MACKHFGLQVVTSPLQRSPRYIIKVQHYNTYTKSRRPKPTLAYAYIMTVQSVSVTSQIVSKMPQIYYLCS